MKQQTTMKKAKSRVKQPLQFIVKLYFLFILFNLFSGLSLFLNLTPTWLFIVEIISINLAILLLFSGFLLSILVLRAKLSKNLIISTILMTIISFLLCFWIALTIGEKEFVHHLTLKNNREIAVYEVWDFLDGFRYSEIMMQVGLLPIMQKITSVPFVIKSMTTEGDFVILQLYNWRKLPGQDKIYININSREYFYK